MENALYITICTFAPSENMSNILGNTAQLLKESFKLAGPTGWKIIYTYNNVPTQLATG